jgi:invasion protein IalB
MGTLHIALLAFSMVSYSSAQTGPYLATQAMIPSPGSSTSQFQEDYRDWRVACVVIPDKTECTLQQHLVDERRQKNVLDIELGARTAGKLDGTLVLPLGIAIDRETSLQVDDGADKRIVQIQTCLPAGCLARIAFDGDFMKSLRKGVKLKVSGFAASGDGIPVTFAISLDGFPEALDRSIALMSPQSMR